MQKTVRTPIRFRGIGLHTGKPVEMTILPASAEYGIWFRRTDLSGVDTMIAARWNMVIQSQLCTQIENADGVSVSTIEHVMAALAGCGIQNALIDVHGPEVPILDGSAAPFVAAILDRGIKSLAAPARAIRVLRPIEVRHGDAFARLDPAGELEIAFEIDFADAAIGRQELTLNLANGSFVRELCDSRTFCRQSDVDLMQANGLALGGLPGENAVVFDGDRVLSPGGLRHHDEPVRHKMLDALGDLALAGAPLLARYSGHRAGHSLTNRLLRALFADPLAMRLETCTAAVASRLPGAGLHKGDLREVA